MNWPGCARRNARKAVASQRKFPPQPSGDYARLRSFPRRLSHLHALTDGSPVRIGMRPGSGFVATIGNDATHPKRSKSGLSLPQPIAGARTHLRLLGEQRRRRLRGYENRSRQVANEVRRPRSGGASGTPLEGGSGAPAQKKHHPCRWCSVVRRTN